MRAEPLRIGLVNMPFATASLPSIALAQLKAAVEEETGERVEVRIHDLNLAFADALGLDLYSRIADSVQAVTSGLGDWFFRPLAFPELEDNVEAYLRRHFRGDALPAEMRTRLLAARAGAGALLDELVRRRGLEEVDILGLTSMFSQNTACFALARRIKEARPEVLTAIGGANCESPMGQVIAARVPVIDFVFSGPSLKTFPRLIELLVQGDEASCHAIRGVFSRRRLEAEGRELTEVGEDLPIDSSPELSFDGYLSEVEETFGPDAVETAIPFETSRGCWWGERSHCTFCGLNGATMAYRSMAPERARQMLERLFSRYGNRARLFQSVDNILPRQYLTEVLPHLEPPEGVELFYEVKADLKEREVEVLARAGVTRIQPGIEALATTTLRLMKKGTTSFQNLRFLKHCLTHGVTPLWNLLIGFPGEEEEVYRKYGEDLPLLSHLPPPAGVYPIRFDRFSPYFSKADEYGLELEPAAFYRMVYPFPVEDLRQMAYYFADRNFEANYLLTTAQWIGRLQAHVDRWRSLWFGSGTVHRPRLELRGRKVIDSRRGDVEEYELEPAELEVLEALDDPRRTSHLVGRLQRTAGDVEACIRGLENRGLLFREDDLYVNLALRPRRSASSLRKGAGALASGDTASGMAQMDVGR